MEGIKANVDQIGRLLEWIAGLKRDSKNHKRDEQKPEM